MPWKNGQGITHEIVISPPGSTLQQNNFDYRISSAEVKSSGPFSLFPGMIRLLVIISGKGLVLNGKAVSPYHVLEFMGEEVIEANLIDKGIIDVGIIFDPSKIHASMNIILEDTSLILTGENYFYCSEGSFMVKGLELDETECLHIEQNQKIKLLLAHKSKVIWINIKHV